MFRQIAISIESLAKTSENIVTISEYLSRLEKLTEKDFEQLSVKYFSDIRETYINIKSEITPILTNINNECKKLTDKSDKLNSEIENLNRGIKPYSNSTLHLPKNKYKSFDICGFMLAIGCKCFVELLYVAKGYLTETADFGRLKKTIQQRHTC